MNSKSNELRRASKRVAPYQEILRAVGQGLESLGITDFDLKVEGDGYFVLGKRADPGAEDAGKPSKKRKLRNKFETAWQKVTLQLPITASRANLSSGPNILRVLFTGEGIHRLQQEGRAKRRADSPGVSNPNQLSQVLRIVGEYLHRRSGKLFKVCKRKDWIVFEYETASDRRMTEKWKIADLYDLWLESPQQRKNRYEVAERTLAADSDKTHL